MKKLISLMMIALLSLGANVSAQEEAEAGAATDSVSGFISENKVVIGAVAVGVAAAIIANNDDDGRDCRADQIIVGGACVCPSGQEEVNGVCQDIVTGPECNAGDELIDGICYGTTLTETLSGTTTILVPVTFTYLPQ
ncbi:hypothetical protein [Planctobacterium marinum]|uniref:hypothetical protein n=1 Tax=Planctobacterium marinum TaxID=1631968 RepID=UPI001E2C55CF|nr:hypothetical protein [Planctobacterium marinum]MCC2606401.1 hypothetical protein [Planctobacterium marinum]